jgi:hypothetical protein
MTTETTVEAGCLRTYYFGDTDPTPSGILIPADTLVWTDFTYGASNSNSIAGIINFYPYADDGGVNVTVAIYGADGNLLGKSLTTFPSACQIDEDCNSLGNTPSGTINQIMSMHDTFTTSCGVQLGNKNLPEGSTFSIALIADHALWLAGWSAADRANGTGPQNGQTPWQTPSTFDTPNITSMPTTLPQAASTSTFEVNFSGTAEYPD